MKEKKERTPEYLEELHQRRLKAKKKWRDNNKIQMQECRDVWASRNIDKIRAAGAANKMRKYHTDPQFKIEIFVRNTFRKWLYCPPGNRKITRGEEYSGAPKEIVRAYLELLFEPGMTWQNHGFKGWHIHHKIPVSSFDLTDPIQLRVCFHYTNWQPMWGDEHLKSHGLQRRTA